VVAEPVQAAWWRRTVALALVVLVIWAMVGVALPAADLEIVRKTPLPPAYLLGVALVPVTMAIVLFVHAACQRAIDRRLPGRGD
jgi:putative solute:sodium symporter small subunit